jgi:hypothetical protein
MSKHLGFTVFCRYAAAALGTGFTVIADQAAK